MKRFSSIFLAFLMLCSFSSLAVNAAPDYSAMSDEEIASRLHLSSDDVAQAREMYKEDFPTVIEDYIKDTSPEISTSFSSMGSYDWSRLSGTFQTGVIIVSKDQSTIVRHGHAALCYTSTDIIEHPGTGKTSRRIAAESSFRNLGAVATFLPKGVTTQQKSQAAYYALNNLLGWSYNALAPRNSNSVMNCATLVWKAYNYAGVNVCSPGSGTVTPSALEVDGYNTRLYATGQYVSAAWPFSLEVEE